MTRCGDLPARRKDSKVPRAGLRGNLFLRRTHFLDSSITSTKRGKKWRPRSPTLMGGRLGKGRSASRGEDLRFRKEGCYANVVECRHYSMSGSNRLCGFGVMMGSDVSMNWIVRLYGWIFSLKICLGWIEYCRKWYIMWTSCNYGPITVNAEWVLKLDSM